MLAQAPCLILVWMPPSPCLVTTGGGGAAGPASLKPTRPSGGHIRYFYRTGLGPEQGGRPEQGGTQSWGGALSQGGHPEPGEVPRAGGAPRAGRHPAFKLRHTQLLPNRPQLVAEATRATKPTRQTDLSLQVRVKWASEMGRRPLERAGHGTLVKVQPQWGEGGC